MRPWSLLVLGLLAGCPKPVADPSPPVARATLDTLSEGQQVEGFTTGAVYLDDGGQRLGARFVHDHTGFVFDWLRLETAPQGFIWVQTVPVSDRGEPHTQEHLLLGKGDKGRAVASRSAMMLVESSAFTAQVRTAYHFHTTSGPEVFHEALRVQLDGLLHPDYTDEEIRREVHHYGVAEDPSGTLHLEEKGTVYNEMVSTSDRWWARLWRALDHALYGPGHGYALDAGGWPADIRAMQPAHIRAFHEATYALGNLGMIGALPPEMGLVDTLDRLDETLVGLQPEPTPPDADFFTEGDLPPADGAPEGEVQVVGYPSAEASRPGEVTLAWPPVRDLDATDRLLLDLFLSALAGSEASPLYERFVDSETRTLDLGATGVSAFRLDRRGSPVLLGVEDVRAEDLTEETVVRLRETVHDELSTIASWEPGDPALADFDRLLRSELAVARRGYRKLIGSPPRFGFRGTSGRWMREVFAHARDGGFERSLTRRPAFEAVEAILEAEPNPWATRLAAWGLLDTDPYGFAVRADPELLERQRAEREARYAAEVQRLQETYGVDDPQTALAAFQGDYAEATEALEAAAADEPMPPFVDAPPMTLDEPLQYTIAPVGDTGVEAFRGHFAAMSGAHAELALSLEGVPREQWGWLAALPALIRRTGVHDDQDTLTHAEVVERLQQEILALSVSTDADWTSGRHELVIAGSGTTPDEARLALGWMARLLAHADWREENLPRIRDLLDEVWSGLRDTTQGSEESWVQGPARALRHQDQGRLLATESFPTATHEVLKLRWTLRSVEDPGAVRGWLEALPASDRDTLTAALEAAAAGDELPELSEADRGVVRDLARDLLRTVSDLPEASLARDVDELAATAAGALERPPGEALDELRSLRDALLVRWRARLVLVGAEPTLAELEPDLAELVGGLVDQPPPEIVEPPSEPLVARRLAERGAPTTPLFPGLVVEDLPSGVFLLSSPMPGYRDTDREALLDVLAGNTYTGHGAHSLFMKTWSAGLAYSNGVRPAVRSGLMRYYAERCPKLPQTLQFVIDTLDGAPVDEGIARYAVAEAFHSRAAASYEGRAAAMAADLEDGLPPETVRAFREGLLALADEPALAAELQPRLPRVYGRAIPGFGPRAAEVDGAVYLVLGPEEQLAAWEQWLRETEDPETRVVRLHPRDFWLP